MNYSEIETINKSLKTVDIKGKDYVQVNDRVMAFRKLYPEGTIETEIVSFTGDTCLIKATVKDGSTVLATGMGFEKESSSFINKTSFVENCETSAVGRAIGFLGIGIDTSIASAEEVKNAIENKVSVCEGCGKQIVPVRGKDGEMISAIQLEQISKKKFGKCLCSECMKNEGK